MDSYKMAQAVESLSRSPRRPLPLRMTLQTTYWGVLCGNCLVVVSRSLRKLFLREPLRRTQLGSPDSELG